MFAGGFFLGAAVGGFAAGGWGEGHGGIRCRDGHDGDGVAQLIDHDGFGDAVFHVLEWVFGLFRLFLGVGCFGVIRFGEGFGELFGEAGVLWGEFEIEVRLAVGFGAVDVFVFCCCGR